MAASQPLFSRQSGLGPLARLVELHEGRAVLERTFAQEGFSLLTRPDQPVPFAGMCRLFERAARATGDSLFGFRVGLAMSPEDYGPFVQYAMCAPSLSGAIHRINKLGALQTNALKFRFEDDGRAVSWSINYLVAPDDGVHQHALHVLLPMIQLLKRYVGHGSRPIGVNLVYQRDKAIREIEDKLEVPIRTDEDGYRVQFPSAWLRVAAENRGNCSDILTLDDVLDHYSTPLPRSMREAVASVLRSMVGESAIGLDDVARRLGLSRRTIQRYLNAEGIGFRNILLAARMTRARRLIEETAEPIVQIALAVGYSDQAHFHRAFRAHTGLTPAGFRAHITFRRTANAPHDRLDEMSRIGE